MRHPPGNASDGPRARLQGALPAARTRGDEAGLFASQGLSEAPVRSQREPDAWTKIIAVGVTVLAVLGVLYSIYCARTFLLPIVVAILLSFLLSPIIRAFARIRVPPPIAAGVLVVGFMTVVGVSVYKLAGPVEELITHAPEMMRNAEGRLRSVARPVDRVTKAADEVERAAAADAPTNTRVVVVKGPSLADRVVGTSQAVGAGALEIVVLLYFLLAGGDLFLEKLVKVLPRLGEKRKAVLIARTIESAVSTYLLTTAAINIGEGALMTLAMWALGLPTPYVWGAIVACLEFIPYVGATIIIAILTVVGLTAFPTVPHALAAPAVYLALNLIQANLVTPLLLGRRLTLNPVALFLGLAFWWWVWGIPGALVAVPLLATFKIVCDHLGSLAPVGEFLSGREHPARARWLGTTVADEPGALPESSPVHA